MCGIAGIISKTGGTSVNKPLLENMLASIGHRGPDARQTWCEPPYYFGHNRLSIIDLSADGTQPLENFDAVITFNGEIYNYLELRAELERKGYEFRTKTDTEVILASYREYGTDCVLKFIGMWSFAIYDRLKDLVFCSRDRFGIKPFYYFSDASGFYFASEYKPFYSVPSFSKDPNLAHISRGLQLGWLCYKDETFLTHLRSLPAAHSLVWQNGSVEISCYWDLTLSHSHEGKTDEEIISGFRALIDDSVRLHMRSDVEVAVCLSGGIDSSVLASSIGTQYPGQPFRTFSIYYDGKGEVDERPFMKEVVNQYPAITPDYYSPRREDVFEQLDQIIYMADVPLTASSNISHYFLTERIHERKIKVVLDGQGVDEYLGGYPHSWYRFLADFARSMDIIKIASEVSYFRKYQQAGMGSIVSLLGKSALSLMKGESSLYNFEYRHFFPDTMLRGQTALQMPDVEGNQLQQFSYQLLFYSSLPTILHYVDRMTMAHSLESRVPFLDHRLVEYAYSLSNRYKIHNGVTKPLIREATKDILPQKIYERKDKKGFVTPGETSWLRHQLSPLLEINYTKLDFIDRKKASEIVKSYKNGDNKNAKLVWRLAMLNRWIEINKL